MEGRAEGTGEVQVHTRKKREDDKKVCGIWSSESIQKSGETRGRGGEREVESGVDPCWRCGKAVGI